MVVNFVCALWCFARIAIYWQDNDDGYPHKDCKWREDETPDPEDFCSAGERRDELEKEPENEYENGFNDAMKGKQELMYEGIDGKWHKKDW